MKNQLKTLEGEPLFLESLLIKEKTNLILFYNTYCIGCTGRAIPFAYKLTKSFPELNVILIHTNFGNQSFTKSQILDIFTSKSSPFDIYIDAEANVYNNFKCEGTPHWVVLDREFQTFRSIFGSQIQSQNRLFYALESLN